MFKFGLELEAFYTDLGGNVLVVPPNISHDDEGVQLEYRGQPYPDITDAVYSLLADFDRVNRKLPKDRKSLIIPLMKIPRDIKLQARRLYTKGTLKYQNLYGKVRHPTPVNHSTAGIHLSVTNSEVVTDSISKIQYTRNLMWDYVSFFRYLDRKFMSQIKEAKRAPGFYELKFDGRIEYRSLPNNITLDKLIDAVLEYKF